MEPYFMDGNRLVNDIKGYIAQLKTTYFESKDPIDDNEIVLQKLCVKLETALRHGMKDKYSFLGMRKDYWNFFSECLPKDEGVRYVNSLSQLHTVQGKGRALIRYCLVQKTLADTIQRTLMRRKKTEWFTPDALLLNSSLSDTLIGKLYDLNELEFHLSCTGCDLDMSWPSFGRTFTDGYEKRASRNSAGSIASTTDFTNERVDPLIALNAEMSALKQMISRELYYEKGTSDDGIGESSMSSNDDAQPNISDITLDISRLHQFILKWKSSVDAKLYKAEHEILRLMEEKDRLSQDSNTQLEQLAERHQNLSDLASKEATLQITGLQYKLRDAETALTDYKTKFDSLSKELQQVSKNNRDSQQTVTSMEKDLKNSQETTTKLENEISVLKENIETHIVDNRTLTEEMNSLKSELQRSQQSEFLLRSKLEESESKLSIKMMEKDKIQEAFENVNGLVFGSFEDFESYYKSQLLDKEKGLEVKDMENKTLQQRLCQLTVESDKLKRELQESLERTRAAQSELVQEVEKLQKQEHEISTSKLETKALMNAIQKANIDLSKLLHQYTDEQAEDSNKEKNNDVRSTEQQCHWLVNNLKELEKHLMGVKEDLAKVLGEKENLDTHCKSMSLEVKRLVQVNEEMENEKAASLLDKQGNQREKMDLEDQVRLLREEKTSLDDCLNCLKEEKTDLESELKEINEKLQEENYSKLVLESEVSEITEQLNQLKNEQADSLQEIERLKMAMEEANSNSEEFEDKLRNCKCELDSVTSKLDTARNELETMEELARKSQEEREKMEGKIASYEEQLANLQCTMDQQISSLRFQLSSEALKYDEEIKTLSEEKQEAMALRDKIQENEETITELENKLEERNETWQTERKKLTSDIKLLKNEIKVLNGNIDADKKEIQSMENTLMLCKKKCDKEKSRNHEYRKTIREIKDQKSENEKTLEQEKSELEEDIEQLKAKLISLLSDKSELWKRSNQLEFDMKTRLSDTWVEDKDVTHCPQCNVPFTILMRKHHCRFCGNIFCRKCSDNFVKTIHSRRPYRSCNSCYKKEKELKSDSSLLSNSSLSQDDSLSIDSHSTDTEEDLTASPSKIAEGETNQQGTPKVLSNEQFDDCTKDQSDHSDDSEENFQIIHTSEHLVGNLFHDDGLSVKHRTRLKPGDGSEDWSEAAIPAGKRYLVDIEGYAGTQLVVEFTTSEKDILFGAAIQETDRTSESKTLVPLCQINSHQRCAKKQLNIASSGVVMLVFDNTHFKSSRQKLRFKVCFRKLTDEQKTSGRTNK